jgi:hypothetical protein
MPEPQQPGQPGTALNSTRQLLDELDALMQRMLSLPVGDAPDAGGPVVSQATAVVVSPATKKPTPAAESKSAPEPDSTTHDSAQEKPTSYIYEQTESEEAAEAESDSEIEVVEEPAEQADDVPAKPGRDSAGVRGRVSAPSSGERRRVSPENRKNPSRTPSRSSPQLSPVSAETLASLAEISTDLDKEQILQRSKLLAAGAARQRRWWLWPLAAVNRTFDLCTHCLGPLGSWLRQPGGRTFLGWVGLALLLAALGLQALMWVAWK